MLPELRLKWESPTLQSRREGNNEAWSDRRIPAGATQETRPRGVQARPQETVGVYTAEDQEKSQEGDKAFEIQESNSPKILKNGKIDENGPRLVIESNGPISVIVPVPAPPAPPNSEKITENF